MNHDVFLPMPEGAIRVPRPSPEVRADRTKRFNEECERNRDHIAKTRKRNMDECQSHWELLDHCYRTMMTQPGPRAAEYMLRAQQIAAELYGCRQFVLGVITGRGYQLPEKELEDLKRAWEEEWDKAFGDLVGNVLKLNVRI